jgi:hypothetical protein
MLGFARLLSSQPLYFSYDRIIVVIITEKSFGSPVELVDRRTKEEFLDCEIS